METFVYVDGFNLYYGALRGGAYKWLNLAKYFELLRPQDTICRIKYFTALVGQPSREDQKAYLSALATLPNVEIVPGKFKPKRVRCKAIGCSHPNAAERFFRTKEEKHTDVNIALYMLDDAYQRQCEQMLLVTADSDLVPAVRMVRMRFPELRVGVYVPAGDPIRAKAYELRSAANFSRDLPLNLLRHALFPATIPVSPGPPIRKPADW